MQLVNLLLFLLGGCHGGWLGEWSPWRWGENGERPRHSHEEARKNVNNSERDARLLNIFTLVRFNNTACVTEDGSFGSCYSASDCLQLGGTPLGKCASGFGSCCLLYRTCGGQTNLNNTYFAPEGFTNNQFHNQFQHPGGAPTICQLTVYKADPDVCRLRLFFKEFALAPPDGNGLCQQDKFIISGSPGVPQICGQASNNHMYVDFNSDAIKLLVTTSELLGTNFHQRKWLIEVTQIPCRENFFSIPPSGCLQYLTGPSGSFRSYNFVPLAGQELANQDYSICIRPEVGFCSIEYRPCQDPANSDHSFSISGDGGGNRTSSTDIECQEDWLIIPCATGSNDDPCVDRLCGTVFSAGNATNKSESVFTSVRPYRLVYHTDGLEDSATLPDGIPDRGFCLTYQQLPCSR